MNTSISPTVATAELFPIREVARQTGINPVTLRAWERRYGLIQPQRSAKGHRLYTPEHIAQIRQVLSWLERGVAVSQVKRLLEDAADIHNLIQPSSKPWLYTLLRPYASICSSRC